MAGVELRGRQQLKRFLTELEERQLPFAEALALTRTAKDVQAAEKETMRAVFDRPTRWTMNSLYVKGATKRRLNARVWFKDSLEAGKGNPASSYLMPQVEGGTRHHKPFTGHLIDRGILPRGMYVVPGKDARLNMYGNITGARINKMVTSLQAQTKDPLQNSTGSNRGRFFVMYQGGGVVTDKKPIGIYERTGKRTIKSFLHFVNGPPTYRKRFPFYRTGQQTAATWFPRRFSETFDYAVKTSRR